VKSEEFYLRNSEFTHVCLDCNIHNEQLIKKLSGDGCAKNWFYILHYKSIFVSKKWWWWLIKEVLGSCNGQVKSLSNVCLQTLMMMKDIYFSSDFEIMHTIKFNVLLFTLWYSNPSPTLHFKYLPMF